MSNPKDTLEQLIDRTLREQPLRHAPASLERRVLTELARRAELPWWRKSFMHWPVAARAVFILTSVGFAKLGADAAVWVMSGLSSPQVTGALATEMSWVQSLGAAFSFVLTFFSLLIRSIPTLWLYGGIAAVAALYLSMFGLSAAAYRALYASR